VNNLVNKQQMRCSHFVGTLVALVVMVGGFCQGWAEPLKADVVHIVSDRFEAYQQERQVIFIGNVVATQGDLIIKGERMTIFYLEEDSAGVNDKELGARIERIKVEGSVRIAQKDTLATGNQAVYYSSDNKVVLTGKPRVKRNKDFIQGERITLFLDSEKSIVEGGPSGPVEATIYSSTTGGSIDRGSVKGVGRSGTDADEGG
jgi:lipopolysaccharide export system protein LptA